jgi:DNA-binding beta-propeller fold protein YncE
VGLAAAALYCLTAVLPSPAFADSVVCEPGEGAGQCDGPSAVAVDPAAKRLYVAEAASPTGFTFVNNRIDVFNTETGAFIEAFGWGVRNGAQAFQICTAPTHCQAGIAGEHPGQFQYLTGLAVDTDPSSASYHDLYVAEKGYFDVNPRVQKLDPFAGSEEKGVEFLLMLGGGVDKTSGEDVCTAASGHVCGAGENSKAEGAFFILHDSGIYPAVSPAGTLYVVDGIALGGENAPNQARLQKFEPSGALISPEKILFEGTGPGRGSGSGLSFDSTGDFWVSGATGADDLFKFDASETQLKALPGIGRTEGVALDSDGNVFVIRNYKVRGEITEYDPAGNILSVFGYGAFRDEALSLAVRPGNQEIYVADAFSSGRLLSLSLPQNGPGGHPLSLFYPEPCEADPIGNATATLRAEVNPEGQETSYHFEYTTEKEFQEHGFTGATRIPSNASEDPKLTGSTEALFELDKISAEVEVTPETEYRCRAVAENAEGKSTGQEGSFTSLPPLEVDATFATAVEEEAATLNAEVNPLGITTSAYFQYVDAATYEKDIEELGAGHGFDHAIKAPEEAIELGAGEEPVAAATKVAGLSPGTEYRYRVVATDLKIAPKEVFGPTAAVRTHSPDEGGLPDDRAYELVSPSQKGGADVAVPGHAGGVFLEERVPRIEASSGSASSPAVSYTSWTSFGGGLGAPAASQYVSERTPDGWKTANVSPFGFLVNPLEPPYRGFSPDLESSAFVVDQPALTPEAQEGIQNLYLRDVQSGEIQALTVEEPQFTPIKSVVDRFCTAYAGASADGTRAFFAADGAMAGAPEGPGFSLYEWTKQAGLSLISVLPGEEGTAAKPAEKTGFGAGSGNCSVSQRIIANAVSEDGKTVFWTYGGKYSGANLPLFARIDGTETLELDQKQTGAKGPSGEGTFWAATADGEKAIFSAPGKLTADSQAAGQLYRFEARAPEGQRLTDLTPGPVAPEIQGVIGASKDSSEIYFVAKGVLTGEEEGPTGEKAQQGQNNLYLWHEGEGVRFVGRLSEEDTSDWQPIPQNITARVSAGGDLAFLSSATQELSGYDNRIFPGTSCKPIIENRYEPEGDPRCAEAYLYDAGANTLACASCNPTGQRPEGPTEVPKWSNPFEGPRYLSDDGTKLFFESRDSLLGADQNHQRDVYEYEQSGSGSCSPQSPTYAQASNGCLYLISSGRSEDDSYLIDASEDGTDVYLSTRQPLVGWDQNPDYDVYDAREGGGFAEPPLIPPICEAEGCKPAPTLPPPAGSSPGTATFQGQPNQAKKTNGKKHRKKPRRHKHKKRQHKHRQRH